MRETELNLKISEKVFLNWSILFCCEKKTLSLTVLTRHNNSTMSISHDRHKVPCKSTQSQINPVHLKRSICSAKLSQLAAIQHCAKQQWIYGNTLETMYGMQWGKQELSVKMWEQVGSMMHLCMHTRAQDYAPWLCICACRCICLQALEVHMCKRERYAVLAIWMWLMCDTWPLVQSVFFSASSGLDSDHREEQQAIQNQ